jgi:hypothetical protein
MRIPIIVRLLLIFVFALLVRWLACTTLVGGLASPPIPLRDDSEYHLLAENLAQGRGLCYGPGHPPTAFRPPLYPLFLAGIYRFAGPNFALARWIQFSLSALGCCFIWLLAREITYHGQAGGLIASSEKIADWAGLFACVNPSLFYHAGYFETEALYLPGLAIAGFFLARMLDPTQRKWALPVAGIALGGLCLLRPNAFLLVILIGPWLWASLASWRKALVVYGLLFLVVVVVMSPWMIRNAAQFHRFIPLTTNGGMNLWGSNNPRLLESDPSRYGAWTGGIVTDMSYLPGSEDLRTSWMSRNYDQFLVDSRCRRLAVQYMLKHPADVCRLVRAKFVRFWTFEIRNNWWERLAFGASEGGMLALAIAGSMFSWRWPRPPHLLLVLFLSTQLNALVFFANTRMRVGIAPAIAIYAAIGLQSLWWRWRRGHAAA